MSWLQQHQKLMHRLVELDIWQWSFTLAPYLYFFQKFIYSDWNFLASLLIMMALDLITGIVKAAKQKKAVTSIGLRNTLIKVFQYGVFLIVVHTLISFQVDGKAIALLNYADECGYTFLIVIEAKSILENLQAIDDRIDFSGLTGKLKSLLPKGKTEE